MRYVDQLLTIANLYATHSEISMGRVSSRVFDDGKVLGRLAGGADLTTRRLENALAWFSDNWPKDLPWPANIGRPAELGRNDIRRPSRAFGAIKTQRL